MLRRLILFSHRWLGTAFCLLFCLWFLSAFGMMYWDYPEVTAADRLSHSPPLDAARIAIAPAQAYAALALSRPPSQTRLVMFDGRPAYRFRLSRRSYVVFADDGQPLTAFPPELTRRIAAAWTGQPPAAAQSTIGLDQPGHDDPDQWTLGEARALRPFDKYSWPDGEQVYVSQLTGEVAQYTTSASRLGAYLGPIPHWLYFTPLRKNGPLWSKLIVWLSGAGVVVTLLGLVGGIWVYWPSKRVPYSGQKRWHMLFGLLFGLTACTWVFSGLLSMEPFDSLTQGPETGPAGLLREPPDLASFPIQPPIPSAVEINPRPIQPRPSGRGPGIKELELTAFDGKPVYLATESPGHSMVIPLDGDPTAEFDRARLIELAASASEPYHIAETRSIDRYDAYYIARHSELPLPALFVRLDDPGRSTFYIDPKTARVVSAYSAASRWNRWLYHGLHSWNFPWLYRYRPAWDIVVIALLAGGSALCITGAVIAWRLLRRKLIY